MRVVLCLLDSELKLLKGYLVGLAEAVWGQAEHGSPGGKGAEASNTTNVKSAHLWSLAP